MDVNVNLVLCIHDVKTTTLRCETPEEEEEETAGEDGPAFNEGTPEEDCARAASEERWPGRCFSCLRPLADVRERGGDACRRIGL